MMEIHKGTQYIITTDGLTAEKHGDGSVRRMKYYPERDISVLAGEIDELTAWRILRDIAAQAEAAATPVCPEHIFIDGDGFVLSEWSASRDTRYEAPEGYSPVWALASTVFYVYLGCHVFQGLGGSAQTRTAPVPTLRSGLPQLSRLIEDCLSFQPAARPTLAEIVEIASRNLSRCQADRSEYPPMKIRPDSGTETDEIDTLWPEEFV